MHCFLIFALKHRWWVLVKTASQSTHVYPQSIIWAKKEENITIFHLKIIILTAVKNCYVLHGHVFVMPIPVEHPWLGGTKVCLNDPGHMTKMVTIIYGNLLQNQKSYNLETWSLVLFVYCTIWGKTIRKSINEIN